MLDSVVFIALFYFILFYFSFIFFHFVHITSQTSLSLSLYLSLSLPSPSRTPPPSHTHTHSTFLIKVICMVVTNLRINQKTGHLYNFLLIINLICVKSVTVDDVWLQVIIKGTLVQTSLTTSFITVVVMFTANSIKSRWMKNIIRFRSFFEEFYVFSIWQRQFANCHFVFHYTHLLFVGCQNKYFSTCTGRGKIRNIRVPPLILTICVDLEHTMCNPLRVPTLCTSRFFFSIQHTFYKKKEKRHLQTFWPRWLE